MPLAIVGGTGKEGFGLCLRWAAAGESIRIGSRSLQRALEAAELLRQRVPRAEVEGFENPAAVAGASTVVLTVPLAGQIAAIRGIRDSLIDGAIVIDTTVPLEKAIGGRLSRLLPLWSGSAAEQAAGGFPSHVRLAAAFHAVSATSLEDLERSIHSDVLIVGDSPEARAEASRLAALIPGARSIDAGPLENARYLEHLAAMLIALNLRHKVSSSGIRFSGLPGLE